MQHIPYSRNIGYGTQFLRKSWRLDLISRQDHIDCLCQLVKWFSEDVSFEQLMAELSEEDRTPEAFAQLQAAYYVHTGIDPLSGGPLA